jgi:hypothetical protein
VVNEQIVARLLRTGQARLYPYLHKEKLNTTYFFKYDKFSVISFILVTTRVSAPNHLNADPDSTFHFHADPDPTFHFNADPDPAYQRDANLRH